MTPSFFPPRVRSIDEGIDFLLLWCEIVGGTQRDGLKLLIGPSGGIRVEPFHVDFPAVGTELEISLVIRDDLTASRYRFQYHRVAAGLLWRADKHPGHEDQFGGPCHLHIGPESDHRVASPEMTLASVADKLLATNLSLL